MKIVSDFNGLFDLYNDIFVFDVETTGFDSIIDDIIEIAIIHLKQKCDTVVMQSKYDYYIKTGKKLPEIITELTGITDDILNENGKIHNDVARDIVDIFGDNKKLLIAHNANFDLNFLFSILNKEKIALDITSMDFLDTLTVFKDRREYPHKLSDAIVAYNLIDDAINTHRAIDDAKATTMVFDRMCAEKDDIIKYINLFGFNPKYPIKESNKIKKIVYKEQPYNMANNPLYK